MLNTNFLNFGDFVKIGLMALIFIGLANFLGRRIRGAGPAANSQS